MSRDTKNRTKAKFVAIVNLIFSGGVVIGLGVWIYLQLKKVEDFSAFFTSSEGKDLIEISILVIVGVSLEASLCILLLFAVKENSFTKLKIWFLIETVFLAAVTLGFLVDLTNPRVPSLVPIFLVIIYKSISLWVVSRLVDEMKAENMAARLISPFASSPESQHFRDREDPLYYSPTSSHSHS